MANVRTETVASSNERAGIAARLKEAREYFGLSQQEVAVALRVPRTAITMIESGQRRVDSLELKALARLYQRPIAYFTGEADLPMSADAALLKQVSKLSDQDKIELLRFSEFLMQRSQVKISR